MRLDPVFLVEPKPPAPSMPTRRAFLFAGSTFAVGISIGGACGYAMGAAAASRPGAGATPEPVNTGQVSSGDAELDELRRLATRAPIDELLQFWLQFVSLVADTYRTDEVLWKGVERICDAVASRSDFPDRRRAGQILAQVIELGEPGLQRLLGDRVRVLRTLR